MKIKKSIPHKRISSEHAVSQKDANQRTLKSLKLNDRRIAFNHAEKVIAKSITDEISDVGFIKKISKSEIKKNLFVAKTDKRDAMKKEALSISNISGYLTGIGIDIESDQFDALDLFAQHIIDLLNSQVYVFANLTKHERFILFRYFYKTNPIIGRILDLHTELPLSKLRLQPPKNCPDPIRDYIMQFYTKIFERLNINEFFRDFVLQYWIYGESHGLMDDYYADKQRTLQNITHIEENQYKFKDEDLTFIDKFEEDYKNDPEDFSLEDLNRYLKLMFLGFFEPNYSGPDGVRTLRFYEITEYFKNHDIDFYAIRYILSDGYLALRSAGESPEGFKEMGYSLGFLKLVDEGGQNSRDIIIDNDSYSGLPFLISFRRFEEISIMQRVIDACLEWDAAKRAAKAKIATIGKLGRIVTADGLSEDQVGALRAEVAQMIEDPNHAIVANYEITWNEVNSFIKEELTSLIEAQDRIINELATGLGVPESLISGESQYTGDNIKVEILNTQYFSFKIKFQNLIENLILRPIATRKGFVTIDKWGNPTLLYPKLTFGLQNLRAAEYFETLFNLYQKGSLPVSIIYDLLNLDGDSIEYALKEDLWTLKNDKFNELISSVLSGAADKILSETDIYEKLVENLALQWSKKQTPPEGGEEGEVPEASLSDW